MTTALRTVPLEPFQRRFAEMEPTPAPRHGGDEPRDAATTIAARLGWLDYKGDLDGGRVRRTLGLRPDTAYFKRGRFYPPKCREWVRLSTALLLCDAMDLDPVELDL